MPIVDDDIELLVRLVRLWTTEGWTVSTAAKGTLVATALATGPMPRCPTPHARTPGV